MSHLVLRGDARRTPLADGSVDLIVTSPPYWAQRSYRDGGDHYAGQIGSEPHPRHWLEAMFEVMKECWRVLAPGGSVFVNLGDKRAGSGGHNNNGLGKSTLGLAKDPASHRTAVAHAERIRATRRNAPDRYEQAHFGRRKSRQLLPERFAIGCEDGLADCQHEHIHDFSHWLMPFGYGAVEIDGYWQPEPCQGIGWIVRQIIVWQKANGLPESVTDRTRDDFEYIYHLTKSEHYFAAVDEIREPHSPITLKVAQYVNKGVGDPSGNEKQANFGGYSRGGQNPLGKTPGSVWRIASEPLRIPDWAKEKYNLPDHFAAFPTEIPRRLILGFSPSGICTACNEPRRPVVEKTASGPAQNGLQGAGAEWRRESSGLAAVNRSEWNTEVSRTITGYACRCSDTSAPTRNAVVLDVFGGTGTTALVAETFGRTGVSLDLGADYCNLARWRIEESGHGAKAEQRTWEERQGTML